MPATKAKPQNGGRRKRKTKRSGRVRQKWQAVPRDSLPGPAGSLSIKFNSAETRYVGVSMAQLIQGIIPGHTIEGAYGPSAIPTRVEVTAMCCGPCANIEMVLGNRTKDFSQDGMKSAWMKACTRVKVACNAPKSVALWPPDLVGKPLNQLSGLFEQIVFRVCGCKDTSIDLMFRIWVRNAGGCTVFGGPPSSVPAGGGSTNNNNNNGGDESQATQNTRYPIVRRTRREVADSWIGVATAFTEDYGWTTNPRPNTEQAARDFVIRSLKEWTVNKAQLPAKDVGQDYWGDIKGTGENNGDNN